MHLPLEGSKERALIQPTSPSPCQKSHKKAVQRRHRLTEDHPRRANCKIALALSMSTGLDSVQTFTGLHPHLFSSQSLLEWASSTRSWSQFHFLSPLSVSI